MPVLKPTTTAIGEEDTTTSLIGEEEATTLAIGEEDPTTTSTYGEEDPIEYQQASVVENPFGSY
jgi:hypothetical protein